MPQYRHLAEDLVEFVRLSQHITDLVRVSGDFRHIKSDVAELDRTFHHIEDLFDRMERQIARGRGVKFGNTAHVKRLLNSVEDSIHIMQEDVAVLEVRSHQHLNQRPTYNGHNHNRGFEPQNYELNRRPTYYGNGYGGNGYGGNYGNGNGGGYCPSNNRGGGFGFTIGGGSSRIRIRF